jgi:DNA-binding response OmpR family regulator
LLPINILIIEDDELTSELISDFLKECGFNVSVVFTATDGASHIKNNPCDIVLLDINLPDFDGFEVLKNIKKYSPLPIIVISAYNDTKTKVMAFKYGASDYMVKPIDLEELEARIWVHLSKNSKIKLEEDKKIFEIKDSYILFKNKKLDLTTIEFDILSLLIENQNRTITREELVASLSSISSHRSLDNHIKNIRKKIGDNGSRAKYLKTEYGVGYRLVIDDK